MYTLTDTFDTKSYKLYLMLENIVEHERLLHAEKHRQLGVPWMGASHGGILLNLHMYGDLTMSEIAIRIKKDPSTVTTLVKRLKKEKMLTSSRLPSDNRKWMLSLLDRGREHCEAMEEFLVREAILVDETINDDEVLLIETSLLKVEKAINCLKKEIYELKKV